MSKGKLLAIVVVWLMLFGIGAAAWKLLVKPRQDAAAQQSHDETINSTSSTSRYDHRLEMRLDAFSGYAVLRSDAFDKELAARSIKITMVDDEADYAGRLAALKSGECQLAVFTIDALLKTCAEINDLPASIVAMIDETRGADAIVGFKDKFRSVDDFNDPDVRFVLAPDSPSETLARVVMTQFDLPKMAKNPIVAAKDAKDVYDRYRKSRPQDPQVFVLWEPYVSKMKENPNVHTIISTRDLFGFVVDVLVVNRDYLRDHEDVVSKVVECYFRSAYKHRNKMKELVFEDARGIGEPLTRAQAEQLVEGVQWKDTQRNYAHFGIAQQGSVQHIEDMIEKIANVLLSTGAIQSDPTEGRPNQLFYDAILRGLEGRQFHPSGNFAEDGSIDDSIKLPALSDREWSTLTDVGTLRVPELVFARGTSKLLGSSKATLNELASALQTQRYYVRIQGVATHQGDRELNLELAGKRAQAAVQYLAEKGVGIDRIRAMQPTLGDVPSVSFSLGQRPY